MLTLLNVVKLCWTIVKARSSLSKDQSKLDDFYCSTWEFQVQHNMSYVFGILVFLATVTKKGVK